MSLMGRRKRGPELLQGTLDVLILKAISGDVLHGFAVAERIQRLSDDVLRVEEGALYPALHRLEGRGCLASHWGFSATHRRAKFYRVTPLGQRQLQAEAQEWARLSGAVSRVLGLA
ncbi:MAG: PadR family transcriptional regulator [Acidobacteriota bacterium]